MRRICIVSANLVAFALAVPLASYLFYSSLVRAYNDESFFLHLILGIGILLLPPILIQSLLLRRLVDKRRRAYSVLLAVLLGGFTSCGAGVSMAVLMMFSGLSGMMISEGTWPLCLSITALIGALVGFVSVLPTIWALE